ncbi:FAD dependent oxidoreductase [Biscogniauxia sp. FL1348]|nr:FAD dependent oxidoreductase [Biscogniauxia sp. FL1348]
MAAATATATAPDGEGGGGGEVPSTPSSIVILGAGIIGVSTAYYLCQEAADADAATIHLVEPCPELFASASGHAGGFLARDWFAPAVAPLGALSFDEHRRLAEREGGARGWGYAPSTAVTDPLQLCQFLLSKCLAAGVHLHQPSRALSILTDPTTGALTGLRITTATATTTPPCTLPCTALVLAAGAWTPSVYSTLFPASPLRLPIASLAGHSLVVEKGGTPRSEDGRCHAVFLAPAPGEKDETTTYAPEVFSRRTGGGDGDVVYYVAGLNASAEPLPRLPTGARAQMSARALQRLRGTAREVLGVEEEGEGEEGMRVLREGLCFRPVTRSGVPIVGRVPGVPDVYVAAGHGPWGISLGLGTGKVVAEMDDDAMLSFLRHDRQVGAIDVHML